MFSADGFDATSWSTSESSDSPSGLVVVTSSFAQSFVAIRVP